MQKHITAPFRYAHRRPVIRICAKLRVCGGLNLAGCQVPAKPLCYFLPQEDWRRGENKMEKTHGSRIRQFNKAKTKAACGSRGKQ